MADTESSCKFDGLLHFFCIIVVSPHLWQAPVASHQMWLWLLSPVTCCQGCSCSGFQEIYIFKKKIHWETRKVLCLYLNSLIDSSSSTEPVHTQSTCCRVREVKTGLTRRCLVCGGERGSESCSDRTDLRESPYPPKKHSNGISETYRYWIQTRPYQDIAFTTQAAFSCAATHQFAISPLRPKSFAPPTTISVVTPEGRP